MTFWYLDKAIGLSRNTYKKVLLHEWEMAGCPKTFKLYGGLGSGKIFRGVPICGLVISN